MIKSIRSRNTYSLPVHTGDEFTPPAQDLQGRSREGTDLPKLRLFAAGKKKEIVSLFTPMCRRGFKGEDVSELNNPLWV